MHEIAIHESVDINIKGQVSNKNLHGCQEKMIFKLFLFDTFCNSYPPHTIVLPQVPVLQKTCI